MKRTPKTNGAIPRLLARIAPFFLPALFFHSIILIFISPLPLFIQTLKRPLYLSFPALATSLIILSKLGASPSELLEIGIFWFGVGVFFPFLIRKSGRVRMSLGLTFGYLVVILLGVLLYRAHELGMNGVEYVRSQISILIDHMISLPNSPAKKLVEDQGKDALFKELMTEVPSFALISILLSLWINLLFASQLVPGFLSRSFWERFRNPEWLVWPTLISAGLYAFSEHAPYYVGLNLFKVLMVFYALQGLSVIGYLFNRYKIFGIARTLLFGLAILMAMPLVLGVGFFDLWFDFRKKFGQI